MYRKNKLKLFIILLSPIVYISNIILEGYPQLVEGFYSTGINKYTREDLNLVTGWLPFSLAEILYYTLVILLLWFLINVIIGIFKKSVLHRSLNLLCYLSVLYVLFMVLWGYNYQRQPLSHTLGYQAQAFTSEELYKLCDELIERANTLRENQEENSQGVTIVAQSYKSVFSSLVSTYHKAGDKYSIFSGDYGKAKAIAISPLMSYTGITGMYMPYTGEANVNYNIPSFMWAVTAAHEMAHQRGFAREDEANFIAYLVCSLSDQEDIQYSGVFLALTYSMNALYDDNQDSFYELRGKYSSGLLRDFKYNRDFWAKYEGKVEKVSNNINDGYLKGNRQEEGVKSYGRMVDLLLAEYKVNH